MVLDNIEYEGVSGAEAFREYWPPSAIKGSVLVTTRNRGSVFSLVRQIIEVKPLTHEEAVKVFYANLTSPPPSPVDAHLENYDQALQLVRELGGLPLAITEAAAYISRTRSTIEAYLDAFKEAGGVLNLLSDVVDTGKYYLKTVTTTWNLSFSQLEKTSSAPLLNVLALLDPDGIPEDLFTEGAGEIDAQITESLFLRKGFHYEDAVGRLAQLALLSRQSKSLYVHRLVQQAALRRMDANEFVDAYEAAAQLTWKVFPKSDRSSLWPHWARAAQYLSQALRLEMHYQWYRDHGKESRHSKHAADLFTQCGKYLRERSLFEQSIRFLTAALNAQESAHGREHLLTASCYYALGRSYLDLMRLDEAISHFQIAADVQKTILGPNHRTTANSLNDLGIAYHESCDLEKAEELYRFRLKVYEELLGPDDPFTVSSLNNLAMIALARGHPAEGVDLTRRSLAAQEQAFGDDHPYLPKTRNYLAFCLRAAGELEEAAVLHRRALQYQEAKLGRQHVSTATSLQGLADVLHDQGHLEEAAENYSQVFHIRRETLKVQHPDRIGASKNYIILLCKLSRFEEAEVCLADIEREAVRELGPDKENAIKSLMAPGRSFCMAASQNIEVFRALPLEGRYVQHQH